MRFRLGRTDYRAMCARHSSQAAGRYIDNKLSLRRFMLQAGSSDNFFEVFAIEDVADL